MSFLPENANNIPQVIANETLTSNTYRMKVSDEQVKGSIDGLDAVRQACYKILNTERYRFVIYSWDYGVELEDLFGMPIPYVFAELPRRITEALEADDRVTSVEGFELSHKGGSVLAVFTVNSTLGTFTMEKEVQIQ